MQARKIILCVVLALVQHCYAAAQEKFFSNSQDGLFLSVEEEPEKNFIFGITGGFGGYPQADLSAINREILGGFNSDATLSDNFPPAFYPGIYFLIRVGKKFFIGPGYQYHATISGLRFSDNSGSYSFDQLIWTHAMGFQVEGALSQGKNYDVFLGARCGVNLCSWKFREDILYEGVQVTTASRADAIRPFLYPALKLRYRLLDQLSITPSLGYNLDLGGNYHMHAQKRSVIDYEALWKGPRAELNVEWTF